MVDMRMITVVAAVLLTSSLLQVALSADTESGNFREWLHGKAAPGGETAPQVRQRRSYHDAEAKSELNGVTMDKAAELSLRRLIATLQREYLSSLVEEVLQRSMAAEADSSDRDVRKRQAGGYWQPMGGPLPVETRFVSFGSRLEPERQHNANVNPTGIKAMRYGRR